MGLAEEIGASLGNNGSRLGVKDATLTRITPGTRDPSNQAAGTNPTSTTHACKAYVYAFESTQIDDTLVKSDDRVVAIFASTIVGGAVPQPGDKVTIGGVVYRIVGGGDGNGVRLDPASVLYLCHGRR